MRTTTRWFVPVAVAATVVGGVAISSARADSAPEVPASTPQKVLENISRSTVTALSGTVVTRTDLGLPSLDLSGMGGSPGGVSATDLQGLATRFLTGKNTLRVWADGESKQRVQLVDPFDELNVVRNDRQVWTYSSRTNDVGTMTLPTRDELRGHPSSTPADLTPAAMAEKTVAALDPTTSVTLGTPERVAGRASYALTFTPKTTKTLVERVVVAVDAEKSVPLQVQVFAHGQAAPAIQTGFTSIDYSTPAAERFTFTPPKGAKVTDLKKASEDATPGDAPATTKPKAFPKGQQPTVTGTGWESVVEFPAPAATPGTSKDNASEKKSSKAMLDQLTTPVQGGRALSSRLLNVLVTDDGRVLAGAVPMQSLVEAAKR